METLEKIAVYSANKALHKTNKTVCKGKFIKLTRIKPEELDLSSPVNIYKFGIKSLNLHNNIKAHRSINDADVIVLGSSHDLNLYALTRYNSEVSVFVNNRTEYSDEMYLYDAGKSKVREFKYLTAIDINEYGVQGLEFDDDTFKKLIDFALTTCEINMLDNILCQYNVYKHKDEIAKVLSALIYRNNAVSYTAVQDMKIFKRLKLYSYSYFKQAKEIGLV